MGLNIALTNFPDGITSFGVPCFGVGGILPFAGNYFWVDETNGSDGNSGGPKDPFATIGRALQSCKAGNNDVVFISGTIHISATLAWNLNNTHLIGLSAPSDNDRSRISQTGSAVFSPLVNVTAQGCVFLNIGTFHGFADASAQICWAEAGGRNFYGNCQFLGMGDATAAAQAGSRSLTVAGSGENLFVGCTVGLDTVVRATNANASLEFLTGTPRNIFRQCVFQSDVSDASDVHVKVGVGGIDRYALFDKCSFINAVESGSTTLNAVATADVSAGGAVILQDCLSLGATAMATAGPVYITGNVPVATTSSIAIKAT